MALLGGLKGAFSSTVRKHLNPTCCSSIGQSKLKPYLIPVASIAGSLKRGPDYKRPPPYPYKDKYFRYYNRWEGTTFRFDDNTKIILVEGPIGVGKTEFAKHLAEEFDMFHLGDSTMDDLYINHRGIDFRTYDDRLPPNLRSFDEKDFCKNPKGHNAAIFQIFKYKLRYARYIDALAHLLSTGQGVVLERSPYSDIVFAEAMFKNGFMSKEAFRTYHILKRHTIEHIFLPHLVIYLDLPVPQVQQRIKERGLPHEKESPVFTDKYLADIETCYKTKVLKDLSPFCEVLSFDWSEGGEWDVVVEEIEKIDFDTLHEFSPDKLHHWRRFKEQEWNDARFTFADRKYNLMANFNVPIDDAPELCATGDEMETYTKVYYDEFGGNAYLRGFDPHFDKPSDWLWKVKTPKHWDPIS